MLQIVSGQPSSGSPTRPARPLQKIRRPHDSPDPATGTGPISPQLAERPPLRILVAEDHLVNQKLALYNLQKMGYRADVVGSGLEVLEALRRQPYDVVLMDVQMPEMDGLTATRLIGQEWLPNERPQIIALTANAMQGDREACLDAGMDDYLSKPIRVEQLIQALEKCQPKVRVEVKSRAVGQSEVSSAPLDPKTFQAFRETTGESSAFLAELIDCYLEQSPKQLQAMKTGIAQGDASALRQAVHTLKSSSAALGATTLASLCSELEVMRTTETSPTESKVLQLEAEYERVKAALQIERQQDRP